MLTTVASFREPWQAHMLHGRLEAEDIPAFVVHEYYVLVDWQRSVGLGGAKVQVPRELADDARAIMQDCHDGVFRALLAQEIGDLDELACPHCGSGRYHEERQFLRSVLAILLFFPGWCIVPPWRWGRLYECEECRRLFRPPPLPGRMYKWAMIALAILAQVLLLLFLAASLRLAVACGPRQSGCTPREIYEILVFSPT